MSKPIEQETIVRAITFPVAEPVDSSWEDFDQALKQAWNDSTALANWGMTELAKADAPRKPTDKKLKPMKRLDLYNKGFTRKGFWGYASWARCCQSASTILRRVDKVYRKARFGIVWTGSQVLPRFRYPYPYPVHNAQWKAELIGGKPHVRFNLAAESWLIRLKSGPELARQLAGFRQILAGAKKGELSIYRQGFREKHVMVKLVAHCPKPPAKTGHTLLLRTTKEAFWVCEREGRQEWILNADQVLRWVENHRQFLQRTSEDLKAERRCGQRPDRNTIKARQFRCEKQQNRIDSKCHEFTAMAANFAIRQGAAQVIYDDTCQEYIESFPWFTLRTKLQYKLEAAGIQLVHRDSPATTAEDTSCPTLQQAAELVRMTGRLAKRRAASASHSEGSPPQGKSNGFASQGLPT